MIHVKNLGNFIAQVTKSGIADDVVRQADKVDDIGRALAKGITKADDLAGGKACFDDISLGLRKPIESLENSRSAAVAKRNRESHRRAVEYFKTHPESTKWVDDLSDDAAVFTREKVQQTFTGKNGVPVTSTYDKVSGIITHMDGNGGFSRTRSDVFGGTMQYKTERGSVSQMLGYNEYLDGLSDGVSTVTIGNKKINALNSRTCAVTEGSRMYIYPRSVIEQALDFVTDGKPWAGLENIKPLNILYIK